LAIWGDDPSTPEIDGAVEGEALSFRLYSPEGESAASVEWIEGEGLYRTDGFARGTLGEVASAPVEWGLAEPYPNPFNPSTTVRFSLAEAAEVRLAVFDLSGREVALLANGWFEAGSFSASWNGESLASGIYLVKLETPSFSATRKATLVR